MKKIVQCNVKRITQSSTILIALFEVGEMLCMDGKITQKSSLINYLQILHLLCQFGAL